MNLTGPQANDDSALIEKSALAAGSIALHYFRSENKVWNKEGDSPVSEADMEVNNYLASTLTEARPDYGWLSEETADSDERLSCSRVFIVDPIDGTRGFLRGDPNWCISIAVVGPAGPEHAVLHCPARNRIFIASIGQGCRLNGDLLPVRTDTSIRRLTGSRRINQAIEKEFSDKFEILPFQPSLAYRLALLASNEVDGVIARGGSHEWDIAAADLIVRETGGCVMTDRGENLRYNSNVPRLPPLIAAGGPFQEALRDVALSSGILH